MIYIKCLVLDTPLCVFYSVSSVALAHFSRTWEQLARKNNMTVEEICAKQPDFLTDSDATKAFYSITVILFLCDMVLNVMYKVSMISKRIAHSMQTIISIYILVRRSSKGIGQSLIYF